MTELELLSYPDLSATEEAEVKELLASIEIVELTPELKQAAIQLEAHGKAETARLDHRGHRRTSGRRTADQRCAACERVGSESAALDIKA